MHWFFIALIPPLLWSLVNNIDKFLLSKYLKVEGPGALFVFSSVAGVLALPVAYLFNQSVTSISFVHSSILILGGIFSGLALYFYFEAIFDEDASSVVALLQLVPIFGFIFGFILLGETITLKEIIACAILILGALFLTFEKPADSRFKLKKRLVITILTSSFFFALYDTLFKFVAITEDFWISIFWQNLGLFIVGIFFFFISITHRKDFLALIKKNGLTILSLNLLNEVLYISGSVIFAYATLLAPIGLVMSVGSYQPIFVMVVSITIARLFFRNDRTYHKDELSFQKISAIIVMLGGSILLYL